MIANPDFWKDRRVLLTGHTGFKGAWMALCLERLGAQVTGIALEPDTDPALFSLLSPWTGITSNILDIRDGAAIKKAVQSATPQIVIHMAAQALVRRSYRDPLETMGTNVMGTANLLDSLRQASDLKAILVITSDKVYRNVENGGHFTEATPLGGDDPYSASKAATEMVAWSWGRSFFDQAKIPVATARAGNVLGGGDFSQDRLVPDAWRAVQAGSDLTLRYPDATRPWQHVLDLSAGYLSYAQRLAEEGGEKLPKALNFGPTDDPGITVGTIARKAFAALGGNGNIRLEKAELAEKKTLAIDAAQARATLGWLPKLDGDSTLDWTTAWYRRFDDGDDPRQITLEQIDRYGEKA